MYNTPLVTADKDLPPLESGQRYILARDGIYVERKTDMFSCCIKGNAFMPHLPQQEEYCVLHTPPLSSDLIREGLGFFEAAYAQHKGEAALVLLYNPVLKEYRWLCPKQRVSYWGMEVKFEVPTSVEPGWLVFGDFHSHPGISPTPSWTDERDEEHRDGLHLIAGYVGEKRKWGLLPGDTGGIELSATFVMDGGRFKLDPLSVLENGVLPDPEEGYFMPPQEWLDQITVAPRTNTWWRGSDDDSEYGGYGKGYSYKKGKGRKQTSKRRRKQP